MKHNSHIDAVTDTIQRMLDGVGQTRKTHSTKDVTINMPEAFITLAVYLSEAGESGVPGPVYQKLIDRKLTLDDKEATSLWHPFFTNRLEHMMHDDFHKLCNHIHPILKRQEENYMEDGNDPIPY